MCNDKPCGETRYQSRLLEEIYITLKLGQGFHISEIEAMLDTLGKMTDRTVAVQGANVP